MRLLHLVLLAAVPTLAHAQAATNADSARTAAPPTGGFLGSPNDPLRGDAKTIAPAGVRARQVQDVFEQNRRTGLRFYNGGADAGCDVEIGGICYWDNNGDVPPPAERNDARIERLQVIEALERAQQADPKDDWVNGMLVRYALEAGQPGLAIDAARNCRGVAWWCHAIAGLAYHVDNRHEASAAAFDKALAAMTEDQRCEWTDLRPWLDTTSHPVYRAKSCAERGELNAFVFRMAQPLWMQSANDVRNEWMSRWTITRIHSLGRLPYDFGTMVGFTQIQLRYGWPTAWSLQAGLGGMQNRSVIGHEPTPSYDFMPLPSALESATTATFNDWDMRRKVARMRYAPRYATGFGLLPHQFARFRRGDTTVVAGAWRLVRDLEMGRAPYHAAFILDSAPGVNPTPVVVRKDSAGANGALLATLGTGAALASLEILAPAGKRAARVRAAVAPLASDARLSDVLLLQRADASGTPMLDRLASTAYGSVTVDRGATIGMYWEMYHDVSPGSPLEVSIRAQRVNVSFFQRLGGSIGLSKAITPVSVRYTDNGRPDGHPGRSLALAGLADGQPGDYRLTVVVSGRGMTDSTSQVITLRGDDR